MLIRCERTNRERSTGITKITIGTVVEDRPIVSEHTFFRGFRNIRWERNIIIIPVR